MLLNLVIFFLPGQVVDKGINAHRPLQKKPVAIVQDKLKTIERIPVTVQDYAMSELNRQGIGDQFPALDYIYSHESGWNPYSVNASSGACHLAQEWPCGKSGCNAADITCEVKWTIAYANERYGGLWAAQIYWENHGNW